jgi:hypothetical protein
VITQCAAGLIRIISNGVAASGREIFTCVPRSGQQKVVVVHQAAESDARLGMCLAELQQLHSLINWYDDAVMRKKSWCIAIWVWVTAFGIHRRDSMGVLLGLAVVGGFALSELVLRRYQRRYVVRAEELEYMLGQGNLADYKFELATTPGRSDRVREIWYALKQPHFTLYYTFYGSNSLGYALFLEM